MLFSKTFGYAVRGLIYVASKEPEGRKVRLEEIAEQLQVPRHFMAKILNRLVKEDLLVSVKGPYGGFMISTKALSIPLLKVMEITDGLGVFSYCVLSFHQCNADRPCSMHKHVEGLKHELREMLRTTNISDLLTENNSGLSGLQRIEEAANSFLSRDTAAGCQEDN